VAVTILSVLFLVATIKTQLRSRSPFIAPIILLATFNPFWQTIDRGNFAWMLGVGLVVLGAKSEVKSERGWLLAVAVSLKI
jgi:O-antigen ligase